MGEILRDIQRVTDTHHADSSHVVSGTQQIFSVGRGGHQHSLHPIDRGSVRHVFPRSIKMQVRVDGQPIVQGGLAGQLVGELLFVGHRLRVRQCGLRQTSIFLQGGNADLLSRLVGELKKLLLRIAIFG
jgi:hypothetical protein